MRKTRKKAISILVTLTFLLTMVFSFAGTAAAWTENRVSTVPTVADDATGVKLGTLTLMEDDDYRDDLRGGESFVVTFPSGVKIKNTITSSVQNAVYWWDKTITDWKALEGASVKLSGDYTLDIELPSTFNSTDRDGIQIRPIVDIDGFDGGDIEVTVEGFDSGITSGTYVIGRVGTGDTSATALSKPTVGEVAKGGIIRITENSVGAIGDDVQDITVKLPADFEWDTGATGFKVDFMSGLSGMTELTGSGVDASDVTNGNYYVDADGRTLTITFDPLNSRSQRGIIQITPTFVANDDADYGDVEVSLSGTNIDDADLVIAVYADFGVAVSADGDVEEVAAGQIDAELAGLKFKENVAGSFVAGRKNTVTFPSWVKITDVDKDKVKNCTVSLNAPDDNEVTFTVTPDSGKAEFILKFTVSVEGNATGDITAEISGRGGAEGSVVLGKALAPVTATASAATKVAIGKKEQAIADITLTEGLKGALMEGDLVIELPEDVEWSSEPTVEVTAGNVEIDEDGIDTDASKLIIPIKSESTKPSTITITSGKVDIDRTVASGAVKASIKGAAVVENDKSAEGYEGWHDYDRTDQGDEDTLDLGEFDTSTVVKVEVATLSAPGEEEAKAVFTIGSTTYTVDGTEQTMDVAPYIKDGRTYVPVRYVAQALGVAADNIFYNAGVVTLLKDARAVQLTIGSKAMLVNGVTISMDAAPEISNGRTMLPFRWVAQALGATVSWDEAAQTVTMEL